MRLSSAVPVFLLLAGMSTNVLAQGNNNNNNNNNDNDNGGNRGNTAVASGQQPANTQPPANSQNPRPSAPSNPPAPPQTNNAGDNNRPPPSTASNNRPPPQSEPPASQTEPPPSLVTSTSSAPGVTLTGISGGSGGGGGDPPPPKYTPPDNSNNFLIPDYPPAAVPNTKGAPYMQKSNLPEGTVFIAVGAALGLIGLIAFAWRMVVAYQLRRSIRKANLAAADSKAGLLGRYTAPPTTKKSFYSAGAGSSLSLDHLGSSRTGLGHTPNASLFFSPTANAGSPANQNRASQYLPAGYYAPAASSNLAFNQSRDSLARPRPATRDSHAVGTPPASPLLLPQSRRPSPGQGHVQAPSISSTLGVQPGGRTPSAYLDDITFPEGGLSDNDQSKRNSRRKSGGPGSGSRR